MNKHAETRFVPLTGYGLIRVQGSDPSKFLQGQLTCDLRLATAGKVLLGGACSPKGRLFATFNLYRQDSGDILLRMPLAIIENFIGTLSRYAALSRAVLTDVSRDFSCLGLIGPVDKALAWKSPQRLPVAGEAVALDRAIVFRHADGGDRHELWVPAGELTDWITELRQKSAEASETEWRLALIRAGQCELSPPLIDQFIPQMLNLDLLDGVSFRKGCYTGQEIVARARYRGQTKRRLFYGVSQSDQEIAVNTAIISAKNGKTVGVVVNAAMADSQCEVLAVLSISSAQQEDLHLIDVTGPLLELRSLPYATIADSDVTGHPAEQ